MTANEGLLLVSALTLIVLSISVVLFFIQTRGNHEWNRRKTAHDLIFQSYIGPFKLMRENLEKKISIYNDSETYAQKKTELTVEDHKTLDAILNYLDNVCLAVKNNVVDENIIFNCISGILISYHRWSKPYICENRARDPRLWIEIDPFVRTWQAREDAIVQRMVEPGKSPL